MLKRRLKYTTPLSLTYLRIRHLCQPSRKEASECARQPEGNEIPEMTTEKGEASEKQL